MDVQQEEREREFEDVLIDVLSQDYDLQVRHSADALERRRRGMACLNFEYQYSSQTQAKVVVSIAGDSGFSNMLPVDFADGDAIARSAEDCEALALYLIEYLDAQEESTLPALDAGEFDFGRREEDLY